MTLTLLPSTDERGSWQADLFSPAASIHDVVAAQGVKGAIEAAEDPSVHDPRRSPSVPRIGRPHGSTDR